MHGCSAVCSQDMLSLIAVSECRVMIVNGCKTAREWQEWCITTDGSMPERLGKQANKGPIML